VEQLATEEEVKKPEPTEVIHEKPNASAMVEMAIRKSLKKPGGGFPKVGLEKITALNLELFQLTEVPKRLEKLTKLEVLGLSGNKLTDVKGLEKLTQLTSLNLDNNPDLTNFQIAELQKALPKCEINSSPTK